MTKITAKYTVTHKLDEGVEIINLWGKQVVKPGDKIVYIPYFKEKGQILMKWKDIPQFQLKYPMIDKWISIGKNEASENILDSLKSGLMNDFGISLIDSFEPEILSPIFLSEDSCQEYYICILPLMEDDYNIQTTESEIPTIALSYADLDNYIIYDLITRHCLNVFRQTYSLF
jgi:hypothetical protein